MARTSLDSRHICALLCALELGRDALCEAHQVMLERVELQLKAALLRAGGSQLKAALRAGRTRA